MTIVTGFLGVCTNVCSIVGQKLHAVTTENSFGLVLGALRCTLASCIVCYRLSTQYLFMKEGTLQKRFDEISIPIYQYNGPPDHRVQTQNVLKGTLRFKLDSSCVYRCQLYLC